MCEKCKTTPRKEEQVFRELLKVLGENPERGGLIETPARALKAWEFWTQGYEQNPADVLKVFEDGAEKYDQMVIVKDMPIYSHCEHHLAPFFSVQQPLLISQTVKLSVCRS